MPTNEPTRAVLEAARNLAGCAHPEHLQQPIALRAPAQGVRMLDRTWCMGCGVVVLEGGDAEAPSLVLAVIEAAREADTFAANVAHAEAHAPPTSCLCRFVLGDRYVHPRCPMAHEAPLMGWCDDEGNCHPWPKGGADEHDAKHPELATEKPGIPPVLSSSEAAYEYERAKERHTWDPAVETWPDFYRRVAAAREPFGDFDRIEPDPVGLRYALDASARRLQLATQLVRELDQVDARAFATHDVIEGAASLDEVRTTARARLREAANAFVEASDELYAACEGKRAGAEP